MLYLSGKKVPGRPLLNTPRSSYALHDVPVWAADNGCFTGTYPGDDKYLALLRRWDEHRSRCLWAAAPDVLHDAPATLARWYDMAPRIQQLGYPAALVLQDGMRLVDMTALEPRPDALFIGGSDTYKMGADVRLISAWFDGPVHMGRVNSRRRMRYAHLIGCQSVDGTLLAFDPSAPVWAWAKQASDQLVMR